MIDIERTIIHELQDIVDNGIGRWICSTHNQKFSIDKELNTVNFLIDGEMETKHLSREFRKIFKKMLIHEKLKGTL